MKTNKPNLFIVGAPKCGTTAMAKYLSEHENIFMSNPKEPHYFATNFPTYRCFTNEEEYISLFSDAKEQETIIGEASVFYLYSEIAIQNIYNYNPQAKIIIMIRNPIEMIYSLHSQLYYSTDEDVKDFEKAWFLQKDRKNNKNIPKYCRDVNLLYYSEVAKYAKQLDNVYKYFPQSQIKVVLFDDFKKDVLNVYKDILSFLNLDYDNRINFPKINENKKVKSERLNILISHIPDPIVSIVSILKKVFKINKLGILDKVRHHNTDVSARKVISNKMRKVIAKEYSNDIRALEILLDRDLSEWKNG